MKQYLKKLTDRNAYTTFLSSSNYITPNVSLCTTENEIYYNPYADTANGHDYVEIDGIKWATMNLGANSITDRGLYYQWADIQGYTADQIGYGEGKKYFDEENYKFYDSSLWGYTKYNDDDEYTTIDLTDDAVHVAWGGSWKIPTLSEWNSLIYATNKSWTSDYQGSGVEGLICTDKTDSSKVLFFPVTGSVLNDDIADPNTIIYSVANVYVDPEEGNRGRHCDTLIIGQGSININVGMATDARYNGYTIRGVLDN